MTTNGRFIWHDLITADTKRALPFYQELFGWKAVTMEMGEGRTYTIFKSGGRDVGGAMSSEQSQGNAPRWNVYFTNPDVDAVVKQVTELGGRVTAGPHDIPNVGRFAMALDPTGTSFSMLTPKDERPDDGSMPGAGEFCWSEAQVDDDAKALAFYTKIFGWTVTDMEMPGGRVYHQVLRERAQPAGGIVKKARPGPNAWLPYIGVDDVDAHVTRAAKLRGLVLAPGTDIPGIGRFGVLQDPTGASFAVFKPLPRTAA